VGNLRSKFGHARPLGSLHATDGQKLRLLLPFATGGGIMSTIKYVQPYLMPLSRLCRLPGGPRAKTSHEKTIGLVEK